MTKLTFASFKEVGLTGAGAIAVTHVHFTESLCLIALHVLNFGRAKWLEDAILQYSAQGDTLKNTYNILLF